MIDYTQNKIYKAVTGEDLPNIAYEQATVKSSDTTQVISPSVDSYGFDEITVQPIVLQDKTVSASNTSHEVTPDPGYDGLSKVTVNAALLQEKTLQALTSQDNIAIPDPGYTGLSKVTVPRIELAAGSATPTNTAQVINPPSGKIGFGNFTVYAAPTETVSVTPSQSQQVLTPSSGNVGFSMVTIAAAPSAPSFKTGWVGYAGTGNGNECKDTLTWISAPTESDYTGYVLNGSSVVAKPWNELGVCSWLVDSTDNKYAIWGYKPTSSSVPICPIFKTEGANFRVKPNMNKTIATWSRNTSTGAIKLSGESWTTSDASKIMFWDKAPQTYWQGCACLVQYPDSNT